MKKLNVSFAGLMGSYDIVIGSISAYSVVFLVANGFDEFQIGMVTSLANLLASFIQPWLGGKVDRSVRLNLVHVNVMIVIPSLALLIGLFFSQKIFLLVAIMYTLVLMLQATLMPFMSATGVFLMNNGFKLNYGVCRAVESASFALTSTILGILITRMGHNSILMMAIIGYSLYLFMLRHLFKHYLQALFNHHIDNVKLNTVEVALKASEVSFFKKYAHFKYIVFGSFCFFVGHNFINLFMLQIIENVGGNTENMGNAIALAAISEMPIMILFTRINRRIPSRYLMMVTGIFFLVKTTLTFTAMTVGGVYLAQVFQVLAFGLYIVASVYYVNHEMANEDKVKGQSLVTTAHTLGSVVGSLIGGWLINRYDVKYGLFFCIIMSALGVIAYFFGLIYQPKSKTLVSK